MNQCLSVIIPTKNEEIHLQSLLADIKKQDYSEIEVIVADGQSSDRTATLASESGCILVETESGRGRQLNAGARQANGDLLLFLHADSQLPTTNLISKAIEHFQSRLRDVEDSKLAGHFAIKFDREETEFVDKYSFYEAKSKLNRISTTNGDQGFLLTKKFFEQIGGFYEKFPFLEDQELAERIREEGSWITLPGYIVTSTRRFEQEGFARRMILSAMMMGLFAIRLDKFFDRSPEVYKEQGLSRGLLELPPFCRLIHQSLWQDGFRQGFKNWYGIGQYVKENAWQLFFLREYHKPPEEQKLLRFHDRYYEPMTRDPAWYSAAMILTMAWFYLTWLYFFVARLRPAKKHAIA